MQLHDGPLRPAAESLRSLEHLISRRVGLVRTLEQLSAAPLSPRVFLFAAEAALLGAKGQPFPRPNCGGAGLTPEQGKVAALAEVVETYCSSSPKGELLFGTYEALCRSHELIAPERFALFSERQYSTAGFPFQRFTRQTPLAWVRGHSLVQHREVLVPASLVYLSHVPRKDEANIGPVTSTGLAAGASLEQAILSGLYECLERDAFTIFWMNDLPARRVDIHNSAHEHEVRQIFDTHLSVPGYEYRVYDITNDLGVPTAYVILRGHVNGHMLYAIGAAARLDGSQAVLKALIEAVQGLPYVAYLMAADPQWQPVPDFSNVEDFTHSARLYSIASHLTPHLLSVEQRLSGTATLEALPRWQSPSQVAAINTLAERLGTRGYEAVAVDVTTNDVEALGMKVVRIVTPELQLLHGSHRFPFQGGPRVYQVPVLLGHRTEQAGEAQLSPYPHPFP